MAAEAAMCCPLCDKVLLNGRGALEDWPTYDEVAQVLLMSRKTIQNLVSKHKLLRRTRYIGRPPYRRRVTRLAPETVRALAKLTRNAFLVRK